MNTPTETVRSSAPQEMFKVVKSAIGSAAKSQAARLGKLVLPGRAAIDTPAFLAVTSRGTVPHVTQDNITKHTALCGSLMALEDFVERKEPPIYKAPHSPTGSLRAFTATPDSLITVLAARRIPQVPAPLGNTEKHVKIFTSTGFADEKAVDYPAHIAALQPDIAVPLADLSQSGTNVPASTKRARRMAYRTESWLDTFLEKLDEQTAREKKIAVFAPVLTLPLEMQWEYIQRLTETAPRLNGLAVYDAQILTDLEAEQYAVLQDLPKMALDTPKTPHDVLKLISLGADVVTAAFVNATSDAGVCLTFAFPTADTPTTTNLLPIGTDMWDPSNRTNVSPLMQNCTCYACTRHHRAFIHHLLQAKEMLGWALLQIHNLHIFSEFLGAVRASLAAGQFEQRKALFTQLYDSVLPHGTGARPRARGYHFKSETDQDKINVPAWEPLNPERPRSRERKEESETSA
ncbi:hypothetical protein TD95_003235 [Thielaviopsis punctulata]|uniref:Queuine tRNA-ribosyltransferase accessory subunit 2 n=1 Tax=Thielaviopsis punctulata TaxID=72032 RepID=A0A0F4ZC86_9PEZI|nr:hypothetical protein TD95_003235 [Thielaviopsis punctulata]